tara:strand:- start:165 stop:620 length:456 start_codon:yes stop_codon:yes gene_type:complete
MKINLKIKPKYSYYLSIFISLIFLFFFAYKGVVAYLIHRELYGGGLDTLVLLRGSISGIMFLLVLLFFQFIKIPDLKSHRTILRGVFIGWTGTFLVITIVNLSSIYFIILTATVSLFTLVNLLSLEVQIKEEKNTLTEKEIYLLQQLAKKK